MTGSPKAFVLMPFDLEFDPIYEGLVKPALLEAGYEVARADSLLDQRNILRDIVRGIAEATLIVAELTTLSPNVLYELGVCHGLRRPTIMLTQSLDEVPFDLRSYRILEYSTRFDKVGMLKQTLQRIAEKHRSQQIEFGSPVTDFVSVSTALAGPDTGALEKGRDQAEVPQLEDEEDKGVLDFLLEGNQAAEQITQIMSTISQDTVHIGQRFEDHTSQLSSLAGSQEPGTASQAHRIASIVAADMNQYSANLEQHLPDLESAIDLLVESFSGYLTWMGTKSGDSRQRAIEFRQSVAALGDGTRSGLDGVRHFRSAVGGMRGMSREMNRACRRLTNILERVISVMEKIEAFCTRSLGLIDEKLTVECEEPARTTK